MKKFYFILCLICAATITAHAQSGTTGSLFWSLSGGTLTISGNGAMPNYTWNTVPWYSYKSSITSVVIGNGVTSIGDNAFSECYYLTSIAVPNSVTYIGNNAFSDCSYLTSIAIPNSLTYIGNNAFAFCYSLYFPNLILPNSVTYIGRYAFLECGGLKSITIPNSVTAINDGTFDQCFGLKYLDIPSSVTSIGNWAFHDCGLLSITIPSSVTSIGNFAFEGSWHLTSITIPSSLTTIGDNAFACDNLTEFINYATSPQTINANVFDYVNLSACTLSVPAASISAYQAANIWKNFGSISSCDCNDNPAPSRIIKYSYDTSGNRTLRKMQEINMSTTSSSSSMLKSSTVGTGTSEMATTEFPKYEDVLQEKKITIYPNPTRGMLRVDISGSDISKDARIYLYNIQGMLITQLTGISETNDLDISSQPEGTYVMRIMLDKNNISTWKIIKE